MRCTRCSAEIPAHSRFCLSCGQPMAASAPTTQLPPRPVTVPAGGAPMAPVEQRRPVWLLIVCIGLLLAVVIALTLTWARRSMLQAGRAKPGGGNMVIAPTKSMGDNMVVAPPPKAPENPVQAPPPQQPQQEKMPADVMAYLRWLAQVDTSRSAMESDGLAEMPKHMARVIDPTGELFADAATGEPNPTAKPAADFDRWYQRLARLQRGFQNLEELQRFQADLGVPGPARVPRQCAMLHNFFGQGLDAQTGAARELSSAIAALDMSRVTKQMDASRRTQELLNRADAEFGAVCELYKVGQFYRIKITPGQTTLPPVTPR